MLADSSTAGIVQNSQDTMLGCYKTLLHSPSYSYSNVKKEANEVSKVGIQQHKYQIATIVFAIMKYLLNVWIENVTNFGSTLVTLRDLLHCNLLDFGLLLEIYFLEN